MNHKSVYKLKHIMLTIYLQLCHNMLTVIQYYIIIKIKKTKASRRDLKKGKNMKIKNKEVMEVKQELNARFGKEQYFDTDSLQPNKTIIEKIENINHCPNQNTCCIVSPFVHCDYNYKSDDCIKAHKNFIHNCEQLGSTNHVNITNQH